MPSMLRRVLLLDVPVVVCVLTSCGSTGPRGSNAGDGTSASLSLDELRRVTVRSHCGSVFSIRNPHERSVALTLHVISAKDPHTILMPGRTPNQGYSEYLFDAQTDGELRISAQGLEIAAAHSSSRASCTIAPSVPDPKSSSSVTPLDFTRIIAVDGTEYLRTDFEITLRPNSTREALTALLLRYRLVLLDVRGNRVLVRAIDPVTQTGFRAVRAALRTDPDLRSVMSIPARVEEILYTRLPNDAAGQQRVSYLEQF